MDTFVRGLGHGVLSLLVDVIDEFSKTGNGILDISGSGVYCNSSERVLCKPSVIKSNHSLCILTGQITLDQGNLEKGGN